MAVEENKALVQRLFAEGVDREDLTLVDELVSPDYVCVFPASAPPMDRDGLKNYIVQFHRAFPDAHHEIEEMIAEGDRVVARVTAHATHRGTFQGIPPTGRQVTISVISIYHIADGKIVGERGEGDFLGLLKQLESPSPTAPH